MKKILLIPIIFISLLSCEENEDVVQKPSRDGSIEVKIAVERQPAFDVYTTHSDVYVKNKLVRTITKRDTLPSLGITKEEGENSEGEVKQLIVPKEYELYITVK